MQLFEKLSENTADPNLNPLIFATCVNLKVGTADCSCQGQGEQHWQPGVQMANYLYMSYGQGQAEQQDKLDAQSQMSTCSYPFIFLSFLFVFCCLCLFSVVFAFCAHAATDSSIIPFPVRM